MTNRDATAALNAWQRANRPPCPDAIRALIARNVVQPSPDVLALAGFAATERN